MKQVDSVARGRHESFGPAGIEFFDFRNFPAHPRDIFRKRIRGYALSEISLVPFQGAKYRRFGGRVEYRFIDRPARMSYHFEIAL